MFRALVHVSVTAAMVHSSLYQWSTSITSAYSNLYTTRAFLYDLVGAVMSTAPINDLA